jgi:hypothetical protein
MPNLNAKKVSSIVREYFDDIKKSKFIFDIIRVEYDDDDKDWEIACEITNLFDEEPRQYVIHIDDDTGDIIDVSEEEE